MIVDWPSDLPRPERNSWQSSYQDARGKRQGLGPVRYRRRLSRIPKLVTLSVQLTRRQKGVFDQFFEESCLEGTRLFRMPDPTTDGWRLLTAAGVPLLTSEGQPLLMAKIWLCAWGDQLPTETVVGTEFRKTFSIQVMP